MDLKRTLEEIKRLQAEANSLRKDNIQLKVGFLSTLNYLNFTLKSGESWLSDWHCRKRRRGGERWGWGGKEAEVEGGKEEPQDAEAQEPIQVRLPKMRYLTEVFVPHPPRNTTLRVRNHRITILKQFDTSRLRSNRFRSSSACISGIMIMRKLVKWSMRLRLYHILLNYFPLWPHPMNLLQTAMTRGMKQEVTLPKQCATLGKLDHDSSLFE